VLTTYLFLACSDPVPLDLDRDGFDSQRDCDDDDAFVHPGAHEFCDGVDNDCDGSVDGPASLGQLDWYEDDDGDGYGDPASAPVTGCDPGPGWSHQPTDCDDADPSRHPGQPDDCDGVDDDCDGTPDDDPREERFADADGDGYGAPGQLVTTCAGSAPTDDDCHDGDPLVHPGAEEYCDGIDSDCDRRDDSIDAWLGIPVWYADLDADGFGLDSVAIEQCVPPGDRWSLVAGDCDDLAADTFPGAVQACTSRDTDCDGQPGSSSGWFAADQPWRVPFVLDEAAPAGTPVVIEVDLDEVLRDGAVPLDLASVSVVLQRCSEDTARLLPAGASDQLSPWLQGGDPAGVLGDNRITVAFVVDEPLPAGAELAVYAGGPPATSPGSVLATTETLQSSLLAVSLDPDRGGLIDEISAGAVRLASQADARDGNGLDLDGSWTQLGPVQPSLFLSSPGAAVLRADGVHEGLQYTAWFSVFDQVPALFVTLRLAADEELAWDGGSAGVRPFDLVPLDLQAPLAESGTDWASLGDETAGLVLAWTSPPPDGAAVSCDGSGCSAVGTESSGTGGAGPGGMALPGEVLVDHRALAVVPYLGQGRPPVPSTVGVTTSPVEAR
jgi:hypothetical protein